MLITIAANKPSHTEVGNGNIGVSAYGRGLGLGTTITTRTCSMIAEYILNLYGSSQRYIAPQVRSELLEIVSPNNPEPVLLP